MIEDIFNDVFKDVKAKLSELMNDYTKSAAYYIECVEDYGMDECKYDLAKYEAKLATLGLLMASVNSEDLKEKMRQYIKD